MPSLSEPTLDDLDRATDMELERLAEEYKVLHVRDKRDQKLEIHQSAMMDNLSKYLAELERYTTIVVDCANAREEHFRKCIYNTKEEEVKHNRWRVAFSQVAARCRDTLLYWKAQYEEMVNRNFDRDLQRLDRNRRRRAKLTRPTRTENPDKDEVSTVKRTEKPDQRATQQRDLERRRDLRAQQERRRVEEQTVLSTLERDADEQERRRDELHDVAVSHLDVCRSQWTPDSIDTFLDQAEVQVSRGNDADPAFVECFPGIVTAPLSLPQTKRFVAILLKTLQHENTRAVWTLVMDRMLMFAPIFDATDFTPANFVLLLGGKLNHPNYPVRKDMLLNFVYAMADAYVTVANRIQDYEWNPAVIGRTLALLDRHSAAYLLKKLSLRIKSVEPEMRENYERFITDIPSFLRVHTGYTAATIKRWYVDRLPSKCLDAQLSFKVYDSYMARQAPRVPLTYVDHNDQQVIARIRLVDEQSDEAKQMRALRRKTKQMCEKFDEATMRLLRK